MKRTLAALALALTTTMALSAAADARSKGGLPDQMLGGWCRIDPLEATADYFKLFNVTRGRVQVLERKKLNDCYDIEIKRTHFTDCAVFDSVKQISKAVWAVEARCEEITSWDCDQPTTILKHRSLRFAIQDGELFIWDPADEGVVGPVEEVESGPTIVPRAPPPPPPAYPPTSAVPPTLPWPTQ